MFAFSATEFPSPIFRSFRQLEGGGVEMFFPQEFNARSQDLPTALHDAGQFYWGTAEAWLQRKRVFEKHSEIIYIPRWRVHDIDTEEDWIRAEAFATTLLR
jgi:N-acylneuraminate cytidylyltransferase